MIENHSFPYRGYVKRIDVLHHSILRFVRPSSSKPREFGVFENLRCGVRFENLCFLLPVNVVYLWTEGRKRRKRSPFQKYLDACARVLKMCRF